MLSDVFAERRVERSDALEPGHRRSTLGSQGADPRASGSMYPSLAGVDRYRQSALQAFVKLNPCPVQEFWGSRYHH